jgi:hypothetical protein
MVMTVKMRGFTFEYGDEFVDLGTDLGLKEWGERKIVGENVEILKDVWFSFESFSGFMEDWYLIHLRYLWAWWKLG